MLTDEQVAEAADALFRAELDDEPIDADLRDRTPTPTSRTPTGSRPPSPS